MKIPVIKPSARRVLLTDGNGTIFPYGIRDYHADSRVREFLSLSAGSKSVQVVIVTNGSIESALGPAKEAGALLLAERGRVLVDPSRADSVKVLVNKDRLNLLFWQIIAPLDEFLALRLPGHLKKEKLTMASYRPPEGITTSELCKTLEFFIGLMPKEVREITDIQAGRVSVDVALRGEEKSKGIKDLYRLGILHPGIELLYTGDGRGDLGPFRLIQRLGGKVGAPANAEPEVVRYMKARGLEVHELPDISFALMVLRRLTCL
jgi:hypothetical protein